MICRFYLLGTLVCFCVIAGEEDNLILRIHDQISVDMSSQWKDLYPSYAVDGNETAYPDTCHCCAGAPRGPAWWRLNLGNVYKISTMILIGRNDNNRRQSVGLSIYKGFSNHTEQQFLRKTSGQTSHIFTISFNPSIELQHLEVNSSHAFAICELKLVEYECPDGQFGNSCESCGKCQTTNICNKINGTCTYGCQPGYKGTLCNDECKIGTFGQNCESTCHCLNKKTCNHVTGVCPRNKCAPGWQAYNCSIECDDGTFGEDCQNKCHCQDQVPCEKVNGTCSSGHCEKGWKGHSCSDKCDLGSFGQNCGSTCHCLNNADCDHINGSCPNNLCAPGWKALDCNKECDDGKFGLYCQNQCHCRDQVSCENVNGSCPSGQCSKGWKGYSCSTTCDTGTFGLNCLSICHCQNNVTCDREAGTCPQNICASGWKGSDCNTECVDGTFGQGCQGECHCLNQMACNKVNGICLSGLCANGWRDITCSTECYDGTFGQNCRSVCHCHNNETCNHVDGSCPNNLCAPGWKETNCNTAIDKQTMDDSSTTGVITGIVIAVVVLTVLVTAGIVYWRRKRNQNDTDLGCHPLTTSEKLREEHNAEHAYTNTTVVYEKNTTVDEPEHIYDGITSTDDSLPIKDLWNLMIMAYDNGFTKLYEEFQAMNLSELQKDPQSARTAKKKNMKKPVYKESRVQLTEDGSPVLTLMDAQYVQGYGGRIKFITILGPSNETVNELWEMVYQENAALIVMLDGPSEQKKTMCIQYWPSEGKVVYGQITIKKVKFTTYSDYAIRKFAISKQNTELRQITQMQFNGWPDDKVPDNAWQFVQFWRKSAMVAEKERGPVLVHSYTSASVGSYIALDSLCRQAQTEGLIHPQGMMTGLFKQRGDLIQTKEQYGFIYEALAEALHVHSKPIKQKDFEEVFISMSKQERDSGKSGLAKQYDIMFQTDTTYTDLQQRASDHLYSDLTTSTGSKLQGNIPAASKTSSHPPYTMILKNYIQQEAFILTTFDESFGEEIWMMIETRKMKTVIRFESGKEDQAIGQPAVQENHAKFSIQLLESKRDNNIIINSYAYMRKDSIKAEVKTVKEFVYLGWQTDELLPSDVQSLIAFICTVQQWQPAVNEKHPVLLCCRTNVKKTEMCLPLLNEFDRIRSTGEVNLLETVKCMAEKDERLIPSFDQYEFCHAVVLEYIKNYDTYEYVC